MPAELAALLEFISSAGSVAFTIWVIYLFLKEQIVPRGRLDDQKALTQQALDGWNKATTANERLADAWEARNEAEARSEARKDK